MNPERWRQIEELYQTALDRDASERAAFLDEACAGDEELRREVESLLAADNRAKESEDFLNQTALQVAAQAVAGDRAQSLVGQKVGRYQILSPLGVGGMGEVYRARDTRLGREVAIKVLPREYSADADRLRRFEQEARAAGVLNHPNILTIYDIGTHGGAPYLVSELLEGATLRALIEHGRLGISEVVKIAEQVAGALSVAHQAAIIHRDIKPENVMVRPDGLVKVLDFGLAKLTERPAATPEADSQAETIARLSTEPGLVMGTVSYMSPEQARGQKVDHRTDIFSLGVMIYELVTGRLPFEGETASDVIAAILRNEPPPLSRACAGLPPGVERLIDSMLEKEREARYQSAAELRAEFQRLQRKVEDTANEAVGTGEAMTVTEAKEVKREIPAIVNGRERMKRWSFARRSWQLTAIGLVALMLAAIIYVRFFHGSPAPPPFEIKTLAVLPFKSLGPETKEDHIGFGIANGIITKVSQVNGLTVRPISAIRKYATEEVYAIEAANQLQVEAVVEGTYQHAGDRLRVSVNLLRTKDGASMWADTFDLTSADIFTIQDQVARQVAMQLRSKLSAGEQKRLATRDTSNPDAYNYYAKAMYHYSNRGVGGKFREETDLAIELFKKAIELDANYARAHAQLGFAYSWIADNNEESPLLIASAKEELRIAEKLDPQLAEVHVARGYILFSHYEGWRIEAAIRELRLAKQLDPNLNTYILALLYFHVGLEDQCAREFELALEIDPTGDYTKQVYLLSHFYLVKPDEWLVLNQRLFSRGPEIRYYLEKRMLKEAAPLIEQQYVKYPDNHEIRCHKALLLALQGKHRDAQAAVPWIMEKVPRTKDYHHYTYNIARIYALGGRGKEAMNWLRTTVDEGFPCYTLFARDSFLDRIRQDPEFIKFMAEMKERWEGYRREFGSG
jgi:TolB-like protein